MSFLQLATSLLRLILITENLFLEIDSRQSRKIIGRRGISDC
jgi:hypothetical protein